MAISWLAKAQTVGRRSRRVWLGRTDVTFVAIGWSARSDLVLVGFGRVLMSGPKAGPEVGS